MPFQNVISIGGNTVSIPILSVSTGPDIFAICDPSATLTAVVVIAPGDNTVHSFLWEQISGDVVSFTTPVTGLVASYTTASFGDKVFKFTADKGTLSEVSTSITVFGTPTSLATISDHSEHTIDNFCRGVTVSFVPLATTINSCAQTSSYTLTWSVPTCDETEHLVEYRAQRKPGLGPWITFDVVPAGGNKTSNTPNTTDVFRILSVYDDNDNYPSNQIYQVSAGLSGIMVSTVPESASYNTEIATYSVDILSLVGKTVTSNITESASATSAIITYTIDDLSLIDKTINSTIIVSASGSASIPTYEIDDLTGIDIGG